ncbi:MAG: NUDIX hydrolase [Gammaproteobacteria bacterium]|nr:NUDIX hydrolase [Gammaproteobacteria bacterium]
MVKRRQAVRALIVSEPDESVLLLRMQRPDRAGDFWLLPGGGVKPNEDQLDAPLREVLGGDWADRLQHTAPNLAAHASVWSQWQLH